MRKTVIIIAVAVIITWLITPKPKRENVNTGTVDRWTLGHATLGATAAFVGLPLLPVAVGAVAWEAFETETFPELFATQDTKENAAVDVAATLGGWVLLSALI